MGWEPLFRVDQPHPIPNPVQDLPVHKKITPDFKPCLKVRQGTKLHGKKTTRRNQKKTSQEFGT